MKNAKQILSLFLTASLLLSVFVSCGEGAGTTDSPTTPSVSAEPEVAADNGDGAVNDRLNIPDGIPELKFDGREFRVCVEAAKEYEIFAEELSGEVTNDVIYNRNLDVAERFDTGIGATVVGDPANQVSTHVQAGEDAFETYALNSYQSYIPIMARAVVNWYDMPYMTFDSPWYNQITNGAATFNGILYNLSCSLAITQMQYTYAMFFNQAILDRYGIPSSGLYQSVYEGKWTWDAFYDLVSGIYEDVNGSGQPDVDDVYGYACEEWNSNDVWLTAFGQPISGKDADGNVTMEIMTDKTVSILEKVYRLAYETPTTFMYPTDTYESYFAQSKIAVAGMPFRVAFNQLRAMEDTYGILPYPKWDEGQETYLTGIHDRYTVFVLPKTYQNAEFVGAIMQALSAESYKTVYPAFYDVALKSKYSSDLDTAAMVDITVAGAGIDFSFMFGESLFQRTPYLIRDMIVAKDTDLASRYNKMKKSLNKSIEKIATYYEP